MENVLIRFLTTLSTKELQFVIVNSNRIIADRDMATKADSVLLSSVNFSVRVSNGIHRLRGHGFTVETIKDLARIGRSQLLKTQFIGRKSIAEIEEVLEGFGINLMP